MRISTVICAYTDERWDDVHAAVDSVRRQRREPYEIIVVVDHNPGLHRRLKESLADCVVIENAGARGLSGGKNTGVAAARGDVVAFLDDDAVAEPGWLAHLAAGYDGPRVAGVGGLTRPLWPGERPAWFPEEFDWVVGCTYRGMPEGRAPVRNLMGGNASFRREAFEVAGGFASHIGRGRDRRPLGCEETEFCIRLRQRSPESVLLFDDRAVIWHKVPAARARFAYFRSRCYAEGLSKALVTASVGGRDGLSSERAHALRALPRGVAAGLRDLARGRPAGASRAGAIVVGLGLTAAGYAAGAMRRRVP
ncbi:glycosyltransferase family 2 protein [Bailinhaonella thermotolerans]|uniref:Glycosyltransferase n=1 Tax=Bailinhaonella thermotolerans TaxID=1070861 RepID=A0A3A4B3A4_9ACTN|nr:glycosyltransferase family 2 protein [Bailinhaonella thermotolerans]RJL32655.1 glycosyltransferase [Bailinhaonella thermotolerans]